MTKQNDEPVHDWSDPDSYAFKGELEFDLAMEFLGRRDVKKCRIVYAFTPGEWPFYDLKTKSVRKEIEAAMYHVEVQAVPELRPKADGTWKLGKPYWLHFEDFCRDDILTHDMQDDIMNAVEARCEAEDAERRKAAGLS